MSESESDGDDTRRELWDRQPGEPARAYHAFRVYLESETRTYAAVRVALGLHAHTVKNYAYNYNWFERSLAWDLEQRKIVDRERIEAYKESARLYAKRKIQERENLHSMGDLLRQMFDFVAAWPLERMVQKSTSNDGRYDIYEPMGFSVGDLPKLAKAYIDVRRMEFELGEQSTAERPPSVARSPDEVAAGLEAMARKRLELEYHKGA